MKWMASWNWRALLMLAWTMAFLALIGIAPAQAQTNQTLLALSPVPISEARAKQFKTTSPVTLENAPVSEAIFQYADLAERAVICGSGIDLAGKVTVRFKENVPVPQALESIKAALVEKQIVLQDAGKKFLYAVSANQTNNLPVIAEDPPVEPKKDETVPYINFGAMPFSQVLDFYSELTGRKYKERFRIHPFLTMRTTVPLSKREAISAMEAAFVLNGVQLASDEVKAHPKASFKIVQIDNKIEIGYGVAVADVDGDKKPDILLADKKQFVWYRNPTWEKFVLAENLTEKDNVCIAARDIDGDGKCEIAVGAEWNPNDTENSGAIFYLVPPSDRTQKWEAVKLPHEPTVHRMKWVKNIEGKFDLVVVPLHGRGNKNGQGNGVKILAYKIPADPKQPWKTELIDDSLHLTHNLTLVDWAMGDDEELLVASREGVFRFVRMREKPGWKKSQYIGGADATYFIPSGAGEVRTGKLADGRDFIATIEPMHGNSLAIYTTPKGDRPISFSARSTLSSSLAEGHALACADFLGIGSDQVVVGWRAKDANGKVGLAVYDFEINPAPDSRGIRATEDFCDNTIACEDLVVADLNADGKPDIVASGRATKNVKAYFNQSGN